ncbi:MAG: hypothetical protein NVV59_00440 [Chitinophagaceae bacterium]|nr:hypothetical protein [Chitinophagaceae bacterium]
MLFEEDRDQKARRIRANKVIPVIFRNFFIEVATLGLKDAKMKPDCQEESAEWSMKVNELEEIYAVNQAAGSGQIRSCPQFNLSYDTRKI